LQVALPWTDNATVICADISSVHLCRYSFCSFVQIFLLSVIILHPKMLESTKCNCVENHNRCSTCGKSFCGLICFWNILTQHPVTDRLRTAVLTVLFFCL